jgi:hypothetical protein
MAHFWIELGGKAGQGGTAGGNPKFENRDWKFENRKQEVSMHNL